MLSHVTCCIAEMKETIIIHEATTIMTIPLKDPQGSLPAMISENVPKFWEIRIAI